MHDRVLVIAAHPDDEVLGCGATAAKLSRDGHDVFIAIFGEGITSRYATREASDAGLVQALQDRAAQVAETLGARDLFTYGLPDNRFDSVPLLDVIKPIEELLGRLNPQVIYTHSGGDLNVDHVVLHRAVLTATRPVARGKVRDIYAFEVPSSTEWAFGQFTPAFRPNVFVEVTDTIDVKLSAMRMYESEGRVFPHPRSEEALRAVATRWGAVSGVGCAEAFELIRSIG